MVRGSIPALAYARPLVLVGAIACGVFAPRTASAQDTQYWMNTFGTRAQLLGGIVVGSPQDISAVYYNPGGLALFNQPEAVLSGGAFRYSALTNEDGLGEGRQLAASSIASLPGMFAGEIPVGKPGGGRLAYSLLTRHIFDGRARARFLTPDSSFNVPNLEYFAGDVSIEESLNDTWVGISWARDLSKHVGFGVSQFVAIRSERARYTGTAQLLDSTGQAAVVVRSREFTYTDWRLLWKAGLTVARNRWSAGLTVTTPSIGLFGSGTAGRTATVVDEGIAPTPVTTLATDYQEEVSSTYQSAASVAAGAAYTLGATTLHGAVEWFAGVDEFRVLDTDPFTSQSTGEVMANDVIEHLDPVVNVGVGVEHRFTPTFSAYGAFRTDNSPLPDSSAANSTLSRWDLTHVSTGVSFTINRLDLVVGTDLTFGGTKSQLPPESTLPGEPAIPADARVKYFAATLLIGFKVGFGAERR